MSELEKFDKILAGIQDIKLEIARSAVKQEQHRKELDILEKKTTNLETDKKLN